MTQDHDHLKLLSIFHYVVAGLAAFFALFPIFHLVFGLFMVLAPEKLEGNDAPAAWFGWIFVVSAALMMTAGFVFALLTCIAGRCLSKRKRYTFCLVMAGIECMFFPFGTALGIFTIILLLRDSVKLLFNGKSPV